MVTEHSFGVIPLRCKGGAWEVLLVKHTAGHWSFPKGHPVLHEEPLATAQRELQEETGLVVEKFLSTDALRERYRYRREGKLVDKTVSYYPALVNGDVVVQEEELLEAAWFSLEKAHQTATFSEAKRLCREVSALLPSGDDGEGVL